MGKKLEFSTPKGKRYLDLDELDAYNKFEQNSLDNKISWKETTSEAYDGSKTFIDEYSFFQQVTPELNKEKKLFNKDVFLCDEVGKFPKNLLSEDYWFKVPKLTEGKNIKTVNLESLTEEEISKINDEFNNEFKDKSNYGKQK